MLAEQAELVAEMRLKDGFSVPAAKMQKSLKKLNVDTAKLKAGLSKVGTGLQKGFKSAAVIAAGGLALLIVNVKAGIDSLVKLEDVEMATAQAIKSTGGIAKVSAKDVRELAERYEDLTTVDDKVIQGAENLLLTFTNVRRKAFEPTIAAALDMSEALDMDLNASVKALGKALQDPAKGISRLTRLGVTFTQAEQDKIAALVKSGKTMDAQSLILGKLNKLYGGRATAAAAGYRGQMNRLGDSVEELQMALAGPLIGPLTQVSKKLAAFAKTKDVQQGIRGIGKAFASLFEDKFVSGADQGSVKKIASPFTKGFDLIKEGFGFLRDLPWEQIKAGASGVFSVAAKAVDIFKSLPPELQGALVTMLAANKLTGGLVASGLKDIGSLVLKSLTTINAVTVTVVGKNVIGGGGIDPSKPNSSGKMNLPLLLTGLGVIAAVVSGDTVQVSDQPAAQQLITVNRAIEHLRGTSDALGQRQLANLQAQKAALEAGNTDLAKAIRDGTTKVVHAGLQGTTKISGTFGRVGVQIASKTAQWGVATVGKLDKVVHAEAQWGVATVGKLGAVLSRNEKAAAAASAYHARVAAWEAQQRGLLGGVKGAVIGVGGAIQRKDLSVVVNTKTTFNVSAREIASEVQRVVGGNRFVAS